MPFPMIRPMSPEALRRYIDGCMEQPLRLDVREEWEYRHCHIEGSVHIPMAQIPARIASLDPARETVLICHHGVRSQRVALYWNRATSSDSSSWTAASMPGRPRLTWPCPDTKGRSGSRPVSFGYNDHTCAGRGRRPVRA
jgi:rhodanese-related sulfurtransferase